MFIRELRRLKGAVKPQWMLLGDFNLFYKAQGKSNDRLNHHMMLRFSRALNHLEVREVELMYIKYTWSNNHSRPTLYRIDMVFYSPSWVDLQPVPTLQMLSSSSFDHCPLILIPQCAPYQAYLQV
jgi:hypothetical protein